MQNPSSECSFLTISDGFFLYTYPDEESEFFFKGTYYHNSGFHQCPQLSQLSMFSADFALPITSAHAKLLYFLDLTMQDVTIEFGAGIFVDIDKEKVSAYHSSCLR